MRKKIVAGNWKMNKSFQEGVDLAIEISTKTAELKNKVAEVVLAPPFIHIVEANRVVDNELVKIAGQNCAAHNSGAYTGEVSAEMLWSAGADYVILGHSERRSYYGETDEILVQKVNQALEFNLTPIFCIGEVLAQREANDHFNVVKEQLEKGLFHLDAEDFEKIVLAYEPVWAIGTGKTATPDQAQEMHAFIRQTLASKYGKEIADNTSILYGGSCKASNAKEIFAKKDVDGGLIGGASLDATEFMSIIASF